MPYKSEAQRRFFHANEGKIGKKVVKEFDAASKGKELVERVKTRIESNRKNG